VTPYQLLNFRIFISSNLAYFVVMARTTNDVSQAVQFASRHNLSISVMSTGHEFQVCNFLANNGKAEISILLSSLQ
jgi:hypothetical protein